MKIYPYSIRTFGGRRICIGKQGENLATRIDVDVTPWKTEYPTGTISLFVVPPVGSGYLAAIEVHENTVRWPIRDTDTAYDGSGKAELILKDADGTVIKSVTAYTTCAPSVSASEPADPPEAIRPWVEQILDAIASGALAGIGIESLEQTTISTDDNGINIWTATLTDGSTYQFEVRNGRRGEKGLQGIQGEVGPQGPQGIQGPQGEPGSIESLTINGKTPDAGGAVTLEMGDIDGLSDAIANAGGVKTVAGVGPDSAGNVPLTAEDVGAATAEEVSALKDDLGNIKNKKNVVIYIGSAELSDEQKLSCDYVCDGIDDQIEINQAIDSLPDSGGEIHLSRGIFNITSAIRIRKRIKLTGEGKGITLDRNNVNNGGTTLLSELTVGCIILIEKSDTLSDIKGITLSDFQIVGAGINVENNFCNGINITTYTDCVTLERLAICHCFYGLFVDQSATADDISITNCDFQRDSTGIYIYGQGWQTRIENNIFWDMSGRQSTSGIVLSSGKNIVNGNYFGVSSLVFQERSNAWISAKNAVSLLCNGNSFSRCTSSPIRFEAGGQFASIIGNSFSEIGKAQFYGNERAVLYVDGAGTGGGRISFTNNTVFWANGDDWKTSYLAYLTNQVAQVNISNNTVIDGIGKINENELVYKSEDSTYAITIGNNVLC